MEYVKTKPVLLSSPSPPALPYLYPRLIFAAFMSMLIMSPLTGWVAVAMMLLEQADVFNGNEETVSTLYFVAQFFSTGGFLLLGALFDLLGARRSALIGGVTVFAALALSGVALLSPKLHYLLFITFPLADLGGNLTSIAIFGFVPYAPQHASLFYGVSTATYMLAALVSFFITSVASASGSVPVAFGAASLVVASATLWLTMALPPPPPAAQSAQDAGIGSCGAFFASICSNARVAAAHLFTGRNRVIGFVGLLCAYFINQSGLLWVGGLEPTTTQLYGEARADRISSAALRTLFVTGTVVAPLLGALNDRFGLQFTSVVCIASFAVMTVLFIQRNFTAALVGAWLSTLGWSANLNFVPIFCTAILPSMLEIGSAYGLMLSIVGVSANIVGIVVAQIANRVNDAYTVYVSAMCAFTTANNISFIVLFVLWTKRKKELP